MLLELRINYILSKLLNMLVKNVFGCVYLEP